MYFPLAIIKKCRHQTSSKSKAKVKKCCKKGMLRSVRDISVQCSGRTLN